MFLQRTPAFLSAPWSHSLYLLKMMLELCPPKPKEFVKATSTLCCIFSPATMMLMSSSSSGLSRLMVGWSIPVSISGVQGLT